MRKSYIFFAFLAFFVLALVPKLPDWKRITFPASVSDSKRVKVYLGESKPLAAELALNAEEQSKGLSNRASLPEDEAMLFVFEKERKLTFWMKEMLIPVDIIWIRNLKIVDIAENIPPPDKETDDANLPIYSPPDLADMALEVNANWSKNNKISQGDGVRIEK